MAVLTRSSTRSPRATPPKAQKSKSKKKVRELGGVVVPLPSQMKSNTLEPEAKRVKLSPEAMDEGICIEYIDDLGMKQEGVETKLSKLVIQQHQLLSDIPCPQEWPKSPTPSDTVDRMKIDLSYQDSMDPEALLKEVISGLLQIDARISQPNFLRGYMRSIFGRQSIKHIHALVLMFLANVQKNDVKAAAEEALRDSGRSANLMADEKSPQRQPQPTETKVVRWADETVLRTKRKSPYDPSGDTSNDLKPPSRFEFEVSRFAYTPSYVGQAGKFQFLCGQNKWETPHDVANTITTLITESVGFQDPPGKVWASFQALLDIGHAIVTSYPDPIMLDHCRGGPIAAELVDGILLIGGLLLQQDGPVKDSEMLATKIEAIMEFEDYGEGVHPFQELTSLHAELIDYEFPRVFDISLLKIKEALGSLNDEETEYLCSVKDVTPQARDLHPAFALPSIVIEHEVNFVIKPYAASKKASAETRQIALGALSKIGYVILQARAGRLVSKSHDPVFYKSMIEDLVTDAMVDIGMEFSVMDGYIDTELLQDIIRLNENRGMAFPYMETVMGTIGLLGGEAREEYIEQEWKRDMKRGNARRRVAEKGGFLYFIK